jgi:mono/diheme cytochrome c family protein
MVLRVSIFILFALASGWTICCAASGGPLVQRKAKGDSISSLSATFNASIVPLLNQYCYECHGNGKHKGDVTLDGWKSAADTLADHKTWERVLQMVGNHEMPPRTKPQPSVAQRELLTKWIEVAVFNCDCDHPDPGRVTVRRLNRVEYNHTIRDLLGVNFQPADDFPVDDSGYGFDNIGDALSLPPILMEKYLAAAEKILTAAIGLHADAHPKATRYPVDLLEVGYNAKQRGDGWVALNSIEEDDVAVGYEVPVEAEYAVRVHAYARQDSTNTIKLTFMLDQKPIHMAELETNQTAPRIYEARVTAPAGKHRFRAVVRRVKDGLPEAEALKWKTGPQQKGAVFVEWLELVGPFNVRSQQVEKTRKRLHLRQPARGREKEAARGILANFARRAYRRPVTKVEQDRVVALAQEAWLRGDSFEEGVGLGLQAILVSPHFLFRGELQPEPDNPKSVHPINEHALASRLSYFLWSTMPDDELFLQAARGSLRKNLDKQVNRMLRDPKSRALVDNFAGQWLQLRNLSLMTPDRQKFRKFDEPLRDAMRQETELLFETIMREDASILDFLNADYTFVNEHLAQHYGISGVAGDSFQRVSLRGTPRRGVLTQASILTLTSNPTRTSPVKRGKWVLDNLLNAPPPPPLPNVPELKEEKVLTGTLRQRMEQHRADPQCASCHARMDPLGFGLENFDGIGTWREKEGEFPIDATGSLVTGETFEGPIELLSILAIEKREQFVRCLADKMLTYALGRGLEYYDKCALDQITRNLARKDYRFSALILEIVKSVPFQMRRGDGTVASAR